MKVNILEGEYWYGSCVKYGMKMPLGGDTEAVIDAVKNRTPNQAMPLWLSTKGRVIWRDTGFRTEFAAGVITVPDDCSLSDTKGGLREAYLYAASHYFPFRGRMPARELFEKIIYNTWIELTFYQNETDVMEYAHKLIASGMPSGVLMIDDGWSEYYGDWRFHSGKFQNPKEMLERLHNLGYEVMLWVCPYISADSVKYREAEKLGLLIKNKAGEPYIAKWWNGYSAVLDFSNPAAGAWLKEQLDALCALGVDGFKFDAGDSLYYEEDNVTYGNVTPDEQSRLWAEFGEQYAFNEYRVTFRAGGYALLQRLCDKEHSWGENGLASLVPDLLLQGITGHPYGCPDMIGGGEYLNFQEMAEGALDEELFVRHAEIAALAPAMQFSAAPYRVLSEENFLAIKKSIKVREKYLPYLLELIGQSAHTGEPVIRYMAYEFKDVEAQTCTDQFMLGDRYLVAPVVKKGAHGRTVYLPRGNWERSGETVRSKGENVYAQSEYGEPVIFTRLPVGQSENDET